MLQSIPLTHRADAASKATTSLLSRHHRLSDGWRVVSTMTEKEPRKTPIGYEDGPDKPTKGAFRLIALAIGVAAIVCIALIVFVVKQSGGI